MLPFYVRILIGLGYITIGIIMLSSAKAEKAILDSVLIGRTFGIACLAYGLFRVYRARQVLNE